ncbi:hypothetical protein DUI87_21419 [Hirundo rustica rustica]|uniref:Uncharacterized protein n=1 Tax=Hirundo rustica rustica TaxID=333673 RepID=A0A3M0JMH9_HIRRU|nr:hypothetical protein DUI87_21419 [Hirundo rustica rustica]
MHEVLCVDHQKLQPPQTGPGCDGAAQGKVPLNTFGKLAQTRDWWKQSGKCQVRFGTGLGDTRRSLVGVLEEEEEEEERKSECPQLSQPGSRAEESSPQSISMVSSGLSPAAPRPRAVGPQGWGSSAAAGPSFASSRQTQQALPHDVTVPARDKLQHEKQLAEAQARQDVLERRSKAVQLLSSSSLAQIQANGALPDLRQPKIWLTLFPSLLDSTLEPGQPPPAELPQPWAQHREDVELLERVQRRLQGEQRDGAALLGGKAGRVGIVQLGKRRLLIDLTVAFQYLRESTRRERAWSVRTRGNGFPLPGGRDRWDIGKKFFPVRVVRPWHGVPREAVAAPFLEVSKARLDRAWSTLG